MAWLSLLHLHLLMLGMVCCIPQDYTRVSRSELDNEKFKKKDSSQTKQRISD